MRLRVRAGVTFYAFFIPRSPLPCELLYLGFGVFVIICNYFAFMLGI